MHNKMPREHAQTNSLIICHINIDANSSILPSHTRHGGSDIFFFRLPRLLLSLLQPPHLTLVASSLAYRFCWCVRMASSSAAVLSDLHRAAEGGGSASASVSALLSHYAPQLLHIEQSIARGVALEDDDARKLYEWVRNYATAHDPLANAAAGDDGAIDSAAPFFFYLLQSGHSSLCLSFLSALYTDAASDQEYFWLADPLAFVDQVANKTRQATQHAMRIKRDYAVKRRIGQTWQTQQLQGTCCVFNSLTRSCLPLL